MKSLHLPGLNGLRAIAAIAVVVSHTLLNGELLGLETGHSGTDLAGFGVSIFFSLSGFLITYLLILEKNKTNTINIKAFYLRRILRIWPLYYLYLLLVVLYIYIAGQETSMNSIWYYIFLCANLPFILGTEIPLIGHYWSLGVEEQFYLFWPLVVRQVNSVKRFLFWFIASFLILKTAFRLLDVFYALQMPYMVIHVTRFECMAIGALGAVYCFQNDAIFNKIVRNRILQSLCWLSLVLMGFNQFHIASFVDNDIVAAITVVLIINVALNPSTIISLETRFFDFLGKISFGIYVIHPLVIFGLGKWLKYQILDLDLGLRYLVVFIVVLFITILLAWLSYTFYEKRFLRLKMKFALVPSSSEK